MQIVLAIALALAIGLPSGWIITMLLTPVLWRLEPILHMELAGHLGPSDWVFYITWVLVIPGLFILFRSTLLKRRLEMEIERSKRYVKMATTGRIETKATII